MGQLNTAAWENSFGYITIDRQTIGVLNEERPSVMRLFNTIVCQAHTKTVSVRQEDNKYRLWGPGTWISSLKIMASAAGLSINTVQHGLYRLQCLGLIERISNKLGTVVQAKKFWQYRRMNPHIGNEIPQREGAFFTRAGDTRKSLSDTYRRDPKLIHTNLAGHSDPDSPPMENFLPREENKARLSALLNTIR